MNVIHNLVNLYEVRKNDEWFQKSFPSSINCPKHYGNLWHSIFYHKKSAWITKWMHSCSWEDEHLDINLIEGNSQMNFYTKFYFWLYLRHYTYWVYAKRFFSIYGCNVERHLLHILSICFVYLIDFWLNFPGDILNGLSNLTIEVCWWHRTLK